MFTDVRDVIAHVVLHRPGHHLGPHADVDIDLPDHARGERGGADRVRQMSGPNGRVGVAVIQVVRFRSIVLHDAGPAPCGVKLFTNPREPRRARVGVIVLST